MSLRVTIYRFACSILLVLLIVGGIGIFVPKCQRLRELQRSRLEIQEDNVRLEAHVEQLIENEREFRTNPAFVERIAREAGMIKSNEMVYRMDE